VRSNVSINKIGGVDVPEATSITVNYRMRSSPNSTFKVQFFGSNGACLRKQFADSRGEPIGEQLVTTDAAGIVNTIINLPLPATVNNPQWLLATATSLSVPGGAPGTSPNNTSEMSQCLAVSSATGPDPISQAGFFVTQHYFDFLSRQPDSAGLAFWTSQITSCGTNQSCIDDKRVNVSASFFLSIEFQQTGYLVERMYKAAFGEGVGASTIGGAHQLAVPIVRVSEFLPDTQRIGQGVIVGQPGWEIVLENNKQAFANEFVQRSRFTTAFPTLMTPAQFVDKLNQNSGNLLSSSDRTAAIALFGSATDTSNPSARSQALRQVAENQKLYNAEFNRAFVLVQYFGYLRRNPNDPPESTLDHSGYDFWLTKLNQFNGNYVAAEMVKAFINSTEYRQRFGL